jgi:hypothetical protein
MHCSNRLDVSSGKALAASLVTNQKDLPAAASRRGMHTQGLKWCAPRAESTARRGNGRIRRKSPANRGRGNRPFAQSRKRLVVERADLAGKGSRNHERRPNRGRRAPCRQPTRSGFRKRLYDRSLVAWHWATLTASGHRHARTAGNRSIRGRGRLSFPAETLQGRGDAIRRMTTKDRAIRIRGMMGNIQAGGVEIKSHRWTSCGLAAVAQETGQTNIHSRSLHRERAFCNPFSTAPDAVGIQKVRAVRKIFLKNLGQRT